MTKESKFKSQFRQTSRWKSFRKKMKAKCKVDAVTTKPLLKGFQVHHMDLNPNHYTNLVDDNFCCLNRQSHEFIHWLYRYKNWREILKNIYIILAKMEQLNESSPNNRESTYNQSDIKNE